jgi:hypothetical protein
LSGSDKAILDLWDRGLERPRRFVNEIRDILARTSDDPRSDMDMLYDAQKARADRTSKKV